MANVQRFKRYMNNEHEQLCAKYKCRVECEIGQLLNSKHVNLLKDQLQSSELLLLILLLLLLLLLLCYHS